MLKWRKCVTSGDVKERCLFKKPAGQYGIASYMCKDDLYIPLSEIVKNIDGIVIESSSISLENCF